MNQSLDQRERESLGLPANPDRVATVASIASGAAVGALIAVFSIAGPTAVAIGAVLGAGAGAVIAKYVAARSKREQVKNAILDREIGVIDGDIGAARSDDSAATGRGSLRS